MTTQEKFTRKKEVRQLINSMLNRLEKQMSLGIFPATMARLSGIRFMRNRLAFLEQASLEAHYRLVVSQETMIRQLMPGTETKFVKFRHQLLELIAESKNYFEVPNLKRYA